MKKILFSVLVFDSLFIQFCQNINLKNLFTENWPKIAQKWHWKKRKFDVIMN